MNKNFYRLVYSKALGMLVAVAEFTRAQRSGSVAVGKAGSGQKLCRLSPVSFSIMLALGAVQPAQATIVADAGAPGGQQPTIISNPGMATQIDIQAPSAAGVSRNSYSQFDVDRNGVILNNSQQGAMTQLGGMVAGNQALAQGAAKIILNEVNSANPSQLNGMIEVAGQQAQVVITNPSGISCDGCGFINASRATLSTGQAQLDNGMLTGYKVEGGEIVVQGAGMNSSASSYTDIIARSVKINSALHAQDVKITTGRNQVDAANKKITALEESTEAQPQLALDVSSLGGMYAEKITLVGTEKGVGVNNAGQIYASAGAGAVIINANGDIVNSGTMESAAAISLAGKNVSNEQYGMLSSAGNTEIIAEGDITNAGSLNSWGELAISAGNIVNSGITSAEENININAKGHLINQGNLVANKNITVSARGITAEESGMITAASGNATLSASDSIRVHGMLHAGGDLNVSGDELNLSGSGVQAQNVTLKANKSLDTRRANINAVQQLKINAGEIANQEGNLSGDKIQIAAGAVNNYQGSVTGQDILVQANGINNQYGYLSGHALKVNASGINNQGGYIQAQDALFIDTKEGLFNNDMGNVLGHSLVELAVGELNNGQGTISGNADITINSSGDIRNQGTIQAGRDLSITAQGDINQSGSLSSENTLTLKANNIVNSGVLVAGGDISVSAGTLYSSAESSITAGSWRDGNLNIVTSGNLIAKGSHSANGRLSLTGENIDLTGSANQAESISLTAKGRLNTSEANLYALGSLELAGNEIINHYGSLSAPSVSITSAILDNQHGYIDAMGELQLDVAVIKNEEGTLTLAGQDIQSADDLPAVEDDSDEYKLPDVGATGNEWASGPALDAMNEVQAAIDTKEIAWRPHVEELRILINYLYTALEKGYAIDDQMVNALARSVFRTAWTEESNTIISSIANIVQTNWQQGKETPPAQEPVMPPAEEEAVTPPVIPEGDIPNLATTGDEMYKDWHSYASVLLRLEQAINKHEINWSTPGNHKLMLEHIVNYMYVALEKGYELDEGMIKGLAQKAWGLGATEDNFAATASVAKIVAAAWQAGK